VHVSNNRLRGIRSLAAVVGLALLASALPASAQSETASAPQAEAPKHICELQSVDLAQGAAQELHAICGDRGLVLGPVSEFSVLANDNLNTMLVDVQYQGDRRILLLSIGKDGLPMVENLTGQIARAAGKGPMSAIDDVTVDLTGFASDGAIAVKRKAGDKEQGGTEAQIRQISVGQQLALEQARPSSGADSAQ